MTLTSTRRRRLPTSLTTLLIASVLVLASFVAGVGLAAPSEGAGTWASAVITEINKERASLGLSALRESGALDTAARRHTAWMAQTNTLSHWLTGLEPDLGGRATKAGYAWSLIAENLGATSTWPSNLSAVLLLQRRLFAEGPGGGHYENLVNPRVVHVGVYIVVDSLHHRTWLTVDFGRPL
jgi:uncharacterized protein YkwD